jgi:hypothetical protein
MKCSKVRDFRHTRKGVPHLKVSGKGGKTRYLPLHPGTHALIHEYLDAAGHGAHGAGMARPREHRDDPDLRSSPHPARGQPDVQSRLLTARLKLPHIW